MYPNTPNCKNLDGCCNEGNPCNCDWIRNEISEIVTNEGVAELAKERGFTVLTVGQVEKIREVLDNAWVIADWGGSEWDAVKRDRAEIDAAIRELSI